MKLSKFAHSLNNKKMLINALTLKKILLHEEVINNFEKIKGLDLSNNELQSIFGEYADILIKEGFIVEEEVENNKINSIIEYLEKPQIQSLYLIVTTNCNLNCNYCFYKADASQSLCGVNKDMSISTAIKALYTFSKLTMNNNVNQESYWQQITFYGGEPLINKHLIYKAVEHINELKKEGFLWSGSNIVINTNAILVNDDFAKFAKEENIEVQISIDGYENIHDKNRYTKDGKGSFKDVIKGIKTFLKYGAKVVPMITVTDDNMEQLDEFVDWLKSEINFGDYGMNILISSTAETNNNYPENAAENMLKCHEFNLQKNGICDYCIGDLMELFNNDAIAKENCGISRKITVFPNEKAYFCQALEKVKDNELGSLDDITIDGIKQRKFKITRFEREECLNCIAIKICGGGCVAGSYNSNNTLKGIDPNYCRAIKHIFDKYMKL
ncbi:MAG TPA: hypothetical protein DCP90_00085 [Clostridiales bacterium]|nr:MAG: hypothetical protein A2Y22_02600 [Clostridiales bacterium GWD2_32_59]HAN08993.1 hypothetical protein [Clostridiales bacterium]